VCPSYWKKKEVLFSWCALQQYYNKFVFGLHAVCTTSDSDLIIFYGHNNFVEIKFFFSKDKIL